MDREHPFRPEGSEGDERVLGIHVVSAEPRNDRSRDRQDGEGEREASADLQEHRHIETRVPGEVDAARAGEHVALVAGRVDERQATAEVPRRHGRDPPAPEHGLLPGSGRPDVGESPPTHRADQPPRDHDRVGPTDPDERTIVHVIVVGVGDQDPRHAAQLLRSEGGRRCPLGEGPSDTVGEDRVGDEGFAAGLHQETRMPEVGDLGDGRRIRRAGRRPGAPAHPPAR